MKLKETIMIAIAALAFLLITGIAKANPITNWITNEKNKIVEYQTTNWAKGKEQLASMFADFSNHIDMLKFEPVNWAAVDDTVYFTVNWEMIWKKTGKLVKTSANVRKVIKDGKIIEKYHIVNYADFQ